MIEEKKLEDVCYTAYQLDWMLSNGYSLEDFFVAFVTNVEIILKNEHKLFPRNRHEMLKLFAEASHETEVYGYDNDQVSTFEGKENFLNFKYLNEAYMNGLFTRMPDGAEYKKAWQHYVGLEA